MAVLRWSKNRATTALMALTIISFIFLLRISRHDDDTLTAATTTPPSTDAGTQLRALNFDRPPSPHLPPPTSNSIKPTKLSWSMFPFPNYPQPSTAVSCYEAEISTPAEYTLHDAYDTSLSFMNQNRRDLPVSAVLLHWKRTAELKLLVEYFAGLNLFTEIVIWNNNPSVTLSDADFPAYDKSRLSLAIYNEGVNLKDQAKYLACLKAINPVCYYQDDDWDTRGYVESLYRAFLKNPKYLHSMTDQYTYLTNLEWSFGDQSIGLHTGFSWIGCGSFFLRQHVVKFAPLMERLLDEDLKKISDVFFSIWMNQMPRIYPHNIRKLTSSHAFSSEPGFFDLQYRAGVESIRILRQHLLGKETGAGFRTGDLNDKRQDWAICPQDECIFMTNAQKQEEPLYFDGQNDLDRATRHNLPDMKLVKDKERSTALAAVDGNRDTCWQGNIKAKEGDYFGLEITKLKPLSHIKLVFDHSWELQNRLRLEGSMDGVKWINMEYSNPLATNVAVPVDSVDPFLYADGQCMDPSVVQPANGTWRGALASSRRSLKKINFVFHQHHVVYRFIRFHLDSDMSRSVKDNQDSGRESFAVCELQAVPEKMFS